MTSPTVKLVYGALELNLNNQTEFGVYPDFTPPDIAYTVAFAGGTSANISGGAELAHKAVANTPFSFRVNVLGGSDADIRKNMGRIRRFLSFAEDPSEPLYLEFNSNSNLPRPLWGQGFFIRYQIAYGTVEYDKGYMVGVSLSTDIDAVLNLILKGYPVGLRQRLASAMGGIAEDVYGASDKTSRGLIVPEATTNLFTNPVFGNATYSTDWTIGSNLTASQNTDEKFVLPGCVNSMRVYARNTTNNTVTKSLTLAASSHTITAYVMLPDLTAPTSTQLQIYYNSAAQTTTYEAVGDNGLYRCYATVTGTGGALATGVVIKNKYAVYLLGMQVEAKAYPTPLCYGDLLGCSWSSTAHASTSTRAVGRVRLPIADDTYFRSGGSLSITVKFSVPSTHPNNMYLMLSDTSLAQLTYFAASDTFSFYDGANTASSSAKTFSAGQVYTFHCVWQASGLTMYINGVADGTNVTFTPIATGSYVYLGSDSTPANNVCGTIMDYRTFDKPLTATEVANDYANVAQLTADNQRVGCIPWLWTKDGDDVVDNCDDSTRDNWAVCGGVPGSAEAGVNFLATLSHSWATIGSVWLSRFDMSEFIIPNGFLYHDLSGTADVGNTSGDAYQNNTVTTSDVSIGSASGHTKAMTRALSEREFYLFGRLYDVGAANLSIYSRISLSEHLNFISSGYKTLSTAAAYRLHITNPVVYPAYRQMYPSESFLPTAISNVFAMVAKRSTGSADVRCDYIAIVSRPLTKLNDTQANTQAGLSYTPGKSASYNTATPTTVALLQETGDELTLVPNKYNLLTSFLGRQDGTNTITWTMTYGSVYIFPKYQLL